MRRKTTNALLGLTGILAILVGTMAPQDANAGDQLSPVGSWFVEVTPDPGPGVPPPFTNLATLLKDGTLINSDPQGFGCHGVWEKMGSEEVATFFICLNADGFTFTVSSDPFDPMIINLDGDEMVGGFTTVITDPGGNPVLSFGGTVMLTRITFPDE